MRRHIRFALVATLSCAAPPQTAFVAPTPANILGERDILDRGGPVHVLSIRNTSSVPITVTGVLLSECANLRNTCGLKRLKIQVPPGQRRPVLEVTPAHDRERFTYRWTFQWQDSSGRAALEVLAATRDPEAQSRVAAIERGDSVRRSEVGMGYPMLGPAEIAQVASRIRTVRLVPDSIRLRPGERVELERINMLLGDSAGEVLGRTRMWRFSFPLRAAFEFVPPGTIVGARVGRGTMYFRLDDDLAQRHGLDVAPMALRVIVAHPQDPRAPLFLGVAKDEATGQPLGCVDVVLEDSVKNETARGRTTREGTFALRPSIPGSYRVLIQIPGWMPVASPLVAAAQGEQKRAEYPARFTEQTIRRRMPEEDRQPARVLSVRSEAVGGPPDRRGISTPIIRGISISGSEATPVLGILGGKVDRSTFAQFVVDSAGAADTASVMLDHPDVQLLRQVKVALARVRFAPATEARSPVCEMQRIQVLVRPM